MKSVKLSCCIIAVSLALSMFCGCATIPPEYRAAHDRVMLKSKENKTYRAGLKGSEITWSYRPEIAFYSQPLDRSTWRDVRFEGLTSETIEKIFEKIEKIAFEEKENYGADWEFGQHAAAALPFTRGLCNKPSFKPVVSCFCEGILGVSAEKHRNNAHKVIKLLLKEFDVQKEQFDTGYYNTIRASASGTWFTFTPSEDGGQKRISVAVYDSTAGVQNSGANNCSFLCNYRGHILETVPGRKFAKK